jgi:hypothetical protein
MRLGDREDRYSEVIMFSGGFVGAYCCQLFISGARQARGASPKDSLHSPSIATQERG